MSGPEGKTNSESETTQQWIGYLQWPTKERVSDRYGTVRLFKSADLNNPSTLNFPEVPVGTYGRLVAEVLETRESSHIGDLFRGLFPETPEVGEILVLGEGVLFQDQDEWGQAVGLRPLEDRDSDWLNPQVLYRLHDQKVHLSFEEMTTPSIKVSVN